MAAPGLPTFLWGVGGGTIPHCKTFSRSIDLPSCNNCYVFLSCAVSKKPDDEPPVLL